MLLLLLLFPSILFSQFRVGGYFQNDLSYADGTEYKAEIANTSQLKVDMNYRDEMWRLLGDFRINLSYGQNNIPMGLWSVQNDHTKLALGLDIPRLYIRINSENAGFFTLGRSYLNFGHAQLFNTLDWFKGFSLTDPTATKPGVNMFAWNIGIGSYSQFKAFVGADDSWDVPIGGAEFILGTSGFEMSFAYQRKGNDINVLGTSFKWDFYVTFFGSYAAHLNDVLTDKEFSHFHDFSLGLDYSFIIGTTTLALSQTFYYNSAGATTEQECLELSLAPNDFYFLSYAYSYTSATFTINEFFNVGTDVIVSFLDGSGAVLPKASFAIINNLTLDLTLALFWGGKNTEFGASDRTPLSVLLARLKVSF